MKITPKYQQGGSFDSFFYIYKPVDVPMNNLRGSSSFDFSTNRSSKSSDDSEKGKLTEKDLFLMIKDIDGLPNEMLSMVSQLMNLLETQNLLGTSLEDLSTIYLKNLYLLKTYNENKKKYDKVMDQVNNDGSLHELAIAPNGDLIYQTDDGNIDTVSVEELKNDPESYRNRMVTVSLLMNLRAYNPELINNLSYFEIALNSMGFEKFQKLIDSVVKTIGSTELRTGSYTTDAEVSEGLKAILELRLNEEVLNALASSNNPILFLEDNLVITKNSAKLIEALTAYIVASLPRSAKTWAAVKTHNSNENEALASLVLTYLLSRTSSITSTKSTLKSLKIGSSSGSGSSSDDGKQTFLTALQGGYVGTKTRRALNLGNNGTLSVDGTFYGALLTPNDQVVSNKDLESMLDDTGISGLTDKKSIYFGDNLIDSNKLKYIAVLNTGGFVAILPAIKQGTSVKPNFEVIKAYDEILKEVNKQIKDNPNDSTETLLSNAVKRQLLAEQLMSEDPILSELLDMSGHINEDNFALFLIVDGLASDLNINLYNTDSNNQQVSILDSPNPHFSETTNEEDTDYFTKVTNLEKDFDSKDWFEFKGGWLGLDYNALYKGSIYIPIVNHNRLAAMIFSNLKLNMGIADKIEHETLINKKIVSNTSSIL